MDKSWMLKDRLSKDYEDGVEKFLRFAIENATDPTKIHCPCTKCGNLQKRDVVEIRDHLYINGIDKTYETWIWHGEVLEPSNYSRFKRFQRDETQSHTNRCDDPIIDMVMDANDGLDDRPEDFINLLGDAEKSIYSGSRMKKLVVFVKLYKLKACSGWIDKIFTNLLALLIGKNLLSNLYHVSIHIANK